MHIYAMLIMGKIFSENNNSQKKIPSGFQRPVKGLSWSQVAEVCPESAAVLKPT